MKKICSLFLLLMSCFFISDCFAQNESELLEKYWNYRDRFLGNDGNGGFVSLGTEQGQSIPMSGRKQNCNCENDWALNNYGCRTGPGEGKMEWGDAMVYQGEYLAVLALEHYNLKKAGRSSALPKIEKELFLAFNAINRLDLAAEEALGMEPSLNGFFMRDDVASDFYIDSTHTSNRRFAYAPDKGYDCAASNFSCGDKSVDDGSFMSQDQIVGLFFGFSVVSTLMRDVPYGKTKATFGDLASEITHRIMDYSIQSNWKLKGPKGNRISNRWGGDLRGFNNLLAKTSQRICGDKYQESYQKGSSKSIGWAASGSFGWGFGIQAERNHWMILAMAVSAGKWNPKKIAKRSLKSDRVMYALAYSVVNNKPLDKRIKKEYLQNLLESAPWDGPCFGTDDCKAPNGWKASDRWIHANHQNGNKYGVHFEYSGLDYMLLYNLYHLLYKDELEMYKRK